MLLEEIHSGFEACSKKIVSASKFIDYFVHDMLDYTILYQNGGNLVKNIDKIDIRCAINEIVEIVIDKILMKSIHIEVIYKGFEDDFRVCTDQKRI